MKKWVSSAASLAAGNDADPVCVNGLGWKVSTVLSVVPRLTGGKHTYPCAPDTGGLMTTSDIPTVTPCFTPGAMIATDRGLRPVETLKRGDKVVTRDNGLKRIEWIGRRDVSYFDISQNDELRPVLIRAHSYGLNKPSRDVVLSPRHRILVSADQTLLDTGGDEALISAVHLIDRRRVLSANTLGVSYLHILCDAHQILLADGLWCESFHPNDDIMAGLGNAQKAEVLELFPEIETMGAARRFPAVRQILQEVSD